MMWTDDPVRDAENYYADREERSADLPECNYCDNKIFDDYFYRIKGENICPSCLREFIVDNSWSAMLD